jgi:hypothetical protein
MYRCSALLRGIIDGINFFVNTHVPRMLCWEFSPMKDTIVELAMNVILYYYHLGLSTNSDNTTLYDTSTPITYYFGNESYIIYFSDVTLLLEIWIIFKNLQFILLFLNTVVGLKTCYTYFGTFRVSNYCWTF